MKLSPVFWPAVKEPRNADAQRPFSGYAFQRKRSWVQLVRGHEARWFSFLPNSAPGVCISIVHPMPPLDRYNTQLLVSGS